MAEPIPTPELQLDQTQGIPISISGCADNIADAQGSNDIDGPAGDLHRRSGIANPGCPHRIPGVAGNTADRCHRAAHDRDFPAGTPAPPANARVIVSAPGAQRSGTVG